MKKLFIIYYSWSNTANNHAGMAYLVRQLKKAHPCSIRLIRVPNKWYSWHPKLKKTWYLFFIVFFKLLIGKKDNILFMEYLGNISGGQAELASKLRKHGLRNNIFGLVHLSPLNLKELYGSESYLIKSLTAINKIIVFGTSLEQYFSQLGFRDKVIKTFHYVDTNYYQPAGKRNHNDRLKVICMGSLKRNHKLLREIIIQCHFADFEVCSGEKGHSENIDGIRNARIHNYLPEIELLAMMQNCDVSLSVLYDTVGSNVIVTSLACGLVNVVSDVGSIRDYCSVEDSILCNGKPDFIDALKKLDSDRKLVRALSKRSVEKALNLDLRKFLEIFPTLIQ